MVIRNIEDKDNAALAAIVRMNLKSYGLDIPGTAYFDPELDSLSAYYKYKDGRAYFVLDDEGMVIGGAGFNVFEGIANCVELQKLYLLNEYKGKGLGKKLLLYVEDEVRNCGYKYMYLETHSSLKEAIGLYRHYGYREIAKPDCVNHSTMDVFMIKEL